MHSNESIQIAGKKELIIEIIKKIKHLSQLIIKGNEYTIDIKLLSETYLDGFGNTLMHFIAMYGYINSLKFFIERGADINIINCKNETPLHLAVKWKKLNIVNRLLQESDIIVDAQDLNGNTALHLAISSNEGEIAKCLVAQSSCANIRNKNGCLPIHLLAIYGHIDLLGLLIEHNPGINVTGCGGKTLLHLAVQCNRLNIIKMLLQQSYIMVDAQDLSGNTALHLAVMFENIDVVRVLIKNNANIDAINGSGDTALHLVAMSDQKETMKFLVENGANVDQKNSEGKRPVDIARKKYKQLLSRPSTSLQAIDSTFLGIFCKILK